MCLKKCSRHAVNQRLGRIVTHKPHGELRGDKPRTLRAIGQQLQHFKAFLLPIGFDLVPQHHLVARLMLRWIKRRHRILIVRISFANRPTGKYFCDFRDIFLGITAVYPDRMQFHQFARVVFIESARRFLGRSPLLVEVAKASCVLRMRPNALGVV